MGGFAAALPTPRDSLTGCLLGSPCVFSLTKTGRGTSRESVRRRLIGRIAHCLLRVNGNFTFITQRGRFRIKGDSFFTSLVLCSVPLRTCVIMRLGTAPFGPRCTKRLGFCVGIISSGLEKRGSGGAVKLLLYGKGSRIITRCTLANCSRPVNVDSCRLDGTVPRGLGSTLPDIRRIRRRLTSFLSGSGGARG